MLSCVSAAAGSVRPSATYTHRGAHIHKVIHRATKRRHRQSDAKLAGRQRDKAHDRRVQPAVLEEPDGGFIDYEYIYRDASKTKPESSDLVIKKQLSGPTVR